MAELRDFMFERVYLGPAVRAEHRRIARVVRRLFEHYVEHPQELPGWAGAARGQHDTDLAQRVTDYLAGMTDRFCIRLYTELDVPQAFAR
jgi:dGTPase